MAETNPFTETGADDEAKTLDDEFSTEFVWQNAVIDGLKRDLVAIGKEIGYNQDLMEGLIDRHALEILGFVESTLFTTDNPAGQPIFGDGEPMDAHSFNSALNLGRTFFGNITGLGPVLSKYKSGIPGSPGSGSGALTPDEIRASFDLDQLASSVTDTYRSLVLDDPKDPRGIARAYVEAIVANPDQKLDFGTFVETHVKKEPRYAMLYKNKPRGMSDAQFMQPYVQAAAQRLRPQNVNETARAGAQLGASPDAFRERLGRSREAQVSTPFITGMENRITELAGVLRG